MDCTGGIVEDGIRRCEELAAQLISALDNIRCVLYCSRAFEYLLTLVLRTALSR